MRTTRLGAVLGTAALLGLSTAGPALAQDTTISASGSGAQEVPGPGEDGSTVDGTFAFDPDANTITYTVTVAGNAEPVAAAHLHEAPSGEAGDIVVTLDAEAANAGSEATVTVEDPELVAEIIADPADYYLNVHSESFPAGFARAQLPAGAGGADEAAGADDASPSSVPAGDGSSVDGSSVLIGTVLLGAGAAVVAFGAARRRRPDSTS